MLSEDGVLPAQRANLQGSPSMCSVTPNSEVCKMSRKRDKCNSDICGKHSCFTCKHKENEEIKRARSVRQLPEATHLLHFTINKIKIAQHGGTLTSSLFLYWYLVLPAESFISLLKTSENSKRKRCRSLPFLISERGSQTWKLSCRMSSPCTSRFSSNPEGREERQKKKKRCDNITSPTHTPHTGKSKEINVVFFFNNFIKTKTNVRNIIIRFGSQLSTVIYPPTWPDAWHH